MKEKIENAAYEIVCKLIDYGFEGVESEPEAEGWEHTISEIIKKHLGIGTLKVGSKIYCRDLDLNGVVTCVTADTIDTIVKFVDDETNLHTVYAYMIEMR